MDTFVRLDNDWISVGHMAGTNDVHCTLIPRTLPRVTTIPLHLSPVARPSHAQRHRPPLPTLPAPHLSTLLNAPFHPFITQTAGTTVTAAIVIGYLLTVANLGDSSAVLDTGCSILELTGSHRIQSNADEQARLRLAGCTLAPLGFHLQGPARQGELGVGPLRLWPGGLCVSRSVGDLDAGPEVVPLPHIRQVRSAGIRVCVCVMFRGGGGDKWQADRHLVKDQG